MRINEIICAFWLSCCSKKMVSLKKKWMRIDADNHNEIDISV